MRRFLFLLTFFLSAGASFSAERPNILWIYVDDMSDWFGCYGHDLVATPNVDQLAAEGVLFERAYMPSPVCSTTRSALITGTMQTSHGLHHHRTMVQKPLPEGISSIPELFRDAGYLTFNEGKDDYNFEHDRSDLYNSEFKSPKATLVRNGKDFTWLEQLKGKNFFGQIQLAGGKIGGESGMRYPSESRVAEDKVTVPPYYPEDPVIRNGLARHYEQVALTDDHVGKIVAALKEYGLWENTIVFFFTDHGSPMPREKQFLYEAGLKVPLIVRYPDQRMKGERRSDLVNGIDIPATSLAMGGIELPSFIEGHDLFAENYQPREYVIGARDRCGIAVDRIRTVRTDRYRYIKNYQTDRAFYQSQYRDRHKSLVQLRKLFEKGALSELQAAYHQVEGRVAEELYDLENDPDQINNLAGDASYAKQLARHQKILADWQKATDDKGAYPASQAELKAVYDYAKGKVAAPEYDFLIKQ